MANITDFVSKLKGGGARANQFKVTLPFPGFAAVGGETESMAFLCSATQLPASTLGEITIPFRGRNIYMAGDREFAEWTTTIINDTDFSIRNAIERWSNGINNHSDNEGLVNPVDYQADLKVEQLDKDGSTIKTYRFIDAFPTSMSSIELGYEQNDVIEEFVCEWSYQYWTSNTTS